MVFKSVTEETTQVNVTELKVELESKSKKVISSLDPFFLEDLSLAIAQSYRLQIMNNLDGNIETYRLRDALIDIDDFFSNMLLPLKLEVEINENIETLDFNISMIDAKSFENPKYYIYCDNSNKIGFRFWFLKNK
jgi:hypothetical protein